VVHRGARDWAVLRLAAEVLDEPTFLATAVAAGESTWAHGGELANRWCHDLRHLRAELRRAVLRLRHTRHRSRAGICQAGYQLKRTCRRPDGGILPAMDESPTPASSDATVLSGVTVGASGASTVTRVARAVLGGPASMVDRWQHEPIPYLASSPT